MKCIEGPGRKISEDTNSLNRMNIALKRLFALTFIGFTLASPALAEDFSDAAEVEAAVTASYDKFKQTASYVGPAIRIMQPGSSYWHKIFLRGYKKGNAPYDLHIYVDTHYTDTRYTEYKQAFDEKGKKLAVEHIDHNVVSCRSDNRCLFEEVFAIDVTKAYLESRMKAEEIEFKVEGRNDYMTFRIPGAYMKGFLNALKNVKL